MSTRSAALPDDMPQRAASPVEQVRRPVRERAWVFIARRTPDTEETLGECWGGRSQHSSPPLRAIATDALFGGITGMCKNHGDAGHPVPPTNAFVPVPGCWTCAAVDAVARAAWRREGGLTLRGWLSVTASGIRHRMQDHGLQPRTAAPGSTGEPPSLGPTPQQSKD
ncbi:hypothetical protein ACFVXW_16005 [Streptomyces sp. NPDC058251]|uniref:hypothetical protein n=1 Tax=unclassified Streptomyces TaxID=2593676 RepID=UPI00366847DE